MSDASALLGASPGAFLGLTLLLFGAAALATGRALARHWRPAWQTLPYAVLLGLSHAQDPPAADRDARLAHGRTGGVA